mmetsp:Transcript_34463/g.63347  ORF Transcript_34463/g.63347 Transcript_34463/m.63347 type:complete len:203 (-) Transcript_34463:516-1124(-)
MAHYSCTSSDGMQIYNTNQRRPATANDKLPTIPLPPSAIPAEPSPPAKAPTLSNSSSARPTSNTITLSVVRKHSHSLSYATCPPNAKTYPSSSPSTSHSLAANLKSCPGMPPKLLHSAMPPCTSSVGSSTSTESSTMLRAPSSPSSLSGTPATSTLSSPPMAYTLPFNATSCLSPRSSLRESTSLHFIVVASYFSTELRGAS